MRAEVEKLISQNERLAQKIENQDNENKLLEGENFDLLSENKWLKGRSLLERLFNRGVK